MDDALETDQPQKKIHNLVVPTGWTDKVSSDGKCFICDMYLRAVNLAWHRIAQHWIKLANAAPDTAPEDREKSGGSKAEYDSEEEYPQETEAHTSSAGPEPGRLSRELLEPNAGPDTASADGKDRSKLVELTDEEIPSKCWDVWQKGF